MNMHGAFQGGTLLNVCTYSLRQGGVNRCTHVCNVYVRVCVCLQVLGAAADALGTAYNAVRPEVQSAALPIKVQLFFWGGG